MPLALKPMPARPLVLYSRPEGDFAEQDGHVASIRRDQRRELDVLTCSPSEATRRLRTWVSSTVPTILILRRGEIVGCAVGRLPRRELETLIHRALL